MRFTQISIIGVLSSLQGCTKEIPVPQLQSQATTSLDAYSSSTKISSAPNSLQSSHQLKSAPNTSESTKIEESVNESSHIVSSINKYNESDSDRIDMTIHNGSNQEVEQPGGFQNAVVPEFRVGQLTVPAIGIQTVSTRDIGSDSRAIASVHSSVDSTNQDPHTLDQQPTDSVIHEEQRGSEEVQNAVSNHTPSSQSSADSNPGSSEQLLNQNQVTDGNNPRHLNTIEESTDGLSSVLHQNVGESTNVGTVNAHVPTVAEMIAILERISLIDLNAPSYRETSREELARSIESVRRTLDAMNNFNDTIRGMETRGALRIFPQSAIDYVEGVIRTRELRMDRLPHPV